jgi:hypothetical protein
MVDLPEPLAPTMAVNLPEGMDSETLFKTVTTCQMTTTKRQLWVGGGTLRTRRIDEGDILDLDVTLNILGTVAFLGEGVDAGNAVDGLENLLSSGNSLGKVFNPRGNLRERKRGEDDGKQTVHDQTDVQLAISNQSRSFPYHKLATKARRT